MDSWFLDVVVGGSQKAFMLPTGLSFISFSAKAWHLVETARLPRYYWDIRPERIANEKNQTYFSSAVSLICALDVVLNEFSEKGLASFHQRSQKLAIATRRGAHELGLHVFPRTPSSSLSCITVPHGIDSQKLRAYMEKTHGITIMGGQDQLSGKVIRIGHMGAIGDDDLIATIEALGLSLSHFAPSLIETKALQHAIDGTTAELGS
jgi:aspartate aminotransferase-like enzyme